MAEDLEVERGGQLYVASFARDELRAVDDRAVDDRAVVSCVEEVESLSMRVCSRLDGIFPFNRLVLVYLFFVT